MHGFITYCLDQFSQTTAYRPGRAAGGTGNDDVFVVMHVFSGSISD